MKNETIAIPSVPESMADALSRAWEYAKAKGLPEVSIALVRHVHRCQRIREGRSRFAELAVEPSAPIAAPSPLADVLDSLPADRREAFERAAAAFEAREGKPRAEWSGREANAVRDLRRAAGIAI